MNRFLPVLLIFFSLSCSRSDTVPKGILAPKKMEAVLWDALLADQTADFYVQKDSSVSALSRHVNLYSQLFQLHKITREDFGKSLHFYEGRPDLLKPILDSLQKKSERLTANKKPVS